MSSRLQIGQMLRRVAGFVGLSKSRSEENGNSANSGAAKTTKISDATLQGCCATSLAPNVVEISREPRNSVTYLLNSFTSGGSDSEVVSEEEYDPDKDPAVLSLLQVGGTSLTQVLGRVRGLSKRCRNYKRLYLSGRAKRTAQQQNLQKLTLTWLSERQQLQQNLSATTSQLGRTKEDFTEAKQLIKELTKERDNLRERNLELRFGRGDLAPTKLEGQQLKFQQLKALEQQLEQEKKEKEKLKTEVVKLKRDLGLERSRCRGSRRQQSKSRGVQTFDPPLQTVIELLMT